MPKPLSTIVKCRSEIAQEEVMPHGGLKILIAGGGIGGIPLAGALRQRGIEALLLEQAKAFSQVGAGFQLSANAPRVLRTPGLGGVLAGVAVYPGGRDSRGGDDGDRLYWTPLG